MYKILAHRRNRKEHEEGIENIFQTAISSQEQKQACVGGLSKQKCLKQTEWPSKHEARMLWCYCHIRLFHKTIVDVVMNVLVKGWWVILIGEDETNDIFGPYDGVRGLKSTILEIIAERRLQQPPWVIPWKGIAFHGYSMTSWLTRDGSIRTII